VLALYRKRPGRDRPEQDDKSGKARGKPAIAGVVVRLTYSVRPRYDGLVIRSFQSRKTGRLFRRERVKEFVSIESVALRRFVALDSAQALSDLLIPRSNRLAPLSGDRKGQHSIRINDQYRICFTWRDGNAEDVEITKHYR
jgi:toxin HigB-1